jgi:tetratricopeptide (TPR) repeat protein
MYSHNMGQAIDYFDLGMLDECYTRLRIILKLWPKNEHARYLIGLVCACAEEGEEALKHLNQLADPNHSQAQRLIRIIEAGMAPELIAKKYLENSSLDAIENEIRKAPL